VKKNLILLIVLLSCISGKLIAQNAKQKMPDRQERVISIDFNKTAGQLNTMFNECVGAGRANEGLRVDRAGDS
jgi:xylan 1,4-beta-xylosidase